jgi:WD40 repeat protein
VSFSPDGEQIVSAGNDGTTRLWECESCLEVEEIYVLAREIVPTEPAPAVRGTFPAPISG